MSTKIWMNVPPAKWNQFKGKVMDGPAFFLYFKMDQKIQARCQKVKISIANR